jgi:O-antigen/teichoic acid export membrane protein
VGTGPVRCSSRRFDTGRTDCRSMSSRSRCPAPRLNAVKDAAAKKNLLSYYLNFSVVALAGLLVNPLLVGLLGSTLFGIWKAVQRFFDIASVADGRAVQALKWIVANRSLKDPGERRRDVGAAVVVWLIWLPVLLTLSIAIVAGTPMLIAEIPSRHAGEVTVVTSILAANLVLAGILSIPDSVLVGVNLGYKSMTATTFIFLASNAVMIAASLAGWGLIGLATTVVAASVVRGLITWGLARRHVAWWGAALPAREDVRRVSAFSAWTLAWVATEKLLLSSELLLISMTLGAVAVADYTFTTYVAQFLLTISLITASAFMPRVGADVVANPRRAFRTVARVKHTVFGITFLGFTGIVAANELFVTTWVGAEYYMGPVVNGLLCVLMLLVSLIRLEGQILDAALTMKAKVGVGLGTTLGGLVCALAVFVVSGNLALALVCMVGFRLVMYVTLSLLVARIFPGASVPLSGWTLAAILCLVAWVASSVSAGESTGAQVMSVSAWLVTACAVAWFGLLPRPIIAGLVSRFRRKR